MFSCKMCASCCHDMRIPLFLPDVDELLKLLGERQFAQNVVFEEGRGLLLLLLRTDGSCPFLEDSKCAIYLRRPLACRSFPLHDPHKHCPNRVKGSFPESYLEAEACLSEEKRLIRAVKQGYYSRVESLLKAVDLSEKERLAWFHRAENMDSRLTGLEEEAARRAPGKPT